MKPANWPAIFLAVMAFFILGIATGWLQDLLFFTHTSIQDNIETCVGGACDTEDGVRAYSSQGWAYAGNGFGLAMLAVRGTLALFIYVLIDDIDYRIALYALLIIPAIMCLVAIMNLPYWFYQALRIAVFICSGSLSITWWRSGQRIIPVPLLLFAVIYNPIIPVELSKTMWMPINLVASLYFLSVATALYLISRSPMEVPD